MARSRLFHLYSSRHADVGGWSHSLGREDNCQRGREYRVEQECEIPTQGNVLRDQIISLPALGKAGEEPVLFRRIEYWNEEKREILVFFTNLLHLAATTIAAIYKDRWQVELFFKALKQTLKVKTFLSAAIGIDIVRFVKFKGKEPVYHAILATDDRVEFSSVGRLITQESFRLTSQPDSNWSRKALALDLVSGDEMAGWGRIDLPQSGFAVAIASAVWAAVGDAFFRELAKHLSSVLGADLVYIGELFDKPVQRMLVLVASKDGAVAEGVDYYSLAGTPSEEVLSRGAAIYERGLRSAFPSDANLKDTGAEAFAGKALVDSHGQRIGALAAVWRHPLLDSSAAVAMLEAFAPRAAAELERKRREDALRESEQRYRAFVASNKDAMWRIEFEEPIPTGLPEDEQIDRMYRHGYVAECNNAMARDWDALSPHALVGARLSEFAPRTEEHVEHLRKMIHSGYTADNVEVRLTDRQGGPAYHIISHLGIVENGKLLRVWGTTRDIGDLKKVLERISMAALILDPEGQVTFCNNHLLAITGWSKDELLGRNWFETMLPEESRAKLKAAFAEFIAERHVYQRYESIVLTRTGARRVFEWDRNLLRDAEGKITGTASIGKDVTEQRALEARLNEAQRLESVGKFAGGIAHDFNNLLTIIRGYADVLLEEQDARSIHDAANEVIKASDQGTALTRQLLAFSRNKPVQARPVNLNGLIVENEGMLRRLVGKQVDLILNLDPSPRHVLADPGQIHQVLVNLATNASDAMPDGGKLTISSRMVEIADERPPAMPDIPPGAWVTLEIADTGTGMTEEVRTHVFEPFFTTKSGRGTGLGLASVYGIVSHSGGYIAVDSAPGEGTTFHILLPAVPQDETAANGQRSPTPQ